MKSLLIYDEGSVRDIRDFLPVRMRSIELDLGHSPCAEIMEGIVLICISKYSKRLR